MRTRTKVSIAFFATALLGAASVWVYGISSQAKRSALKTDLDGRSVTDAMTILKKERFMWSRFGGIKARISVASNNQDEPRALEADISIAATATPNAPTSGVLARFEATLSDPQSQWTVYTNGKSDGERITGNSELAAVFTQNATPETILSLMTMPYYVILSTYRDSLFPKGKFTLNQMFGMWGPCSNQEAAGTPHSYTFKDNDSFFNPISFTAGHISEWRRLDRSKAPPSVETVVRFESPFKSNGFWYPTKIDCQAPNETVSIKISNVAVIVTR